MRTRDDHDHRRRSRSREEEGDETPKTYTGMPTQANADGALRKSPVLLWILAFSMAVLGIAMITVAVVVALARKDSAPDRHEVLVPPEVLDVVGKDEMTLTAFILQKPAGPTRIHVNCKLSTHYNWAFRDCAETHYSFDISNSDAQFHLCHVYAPKNSRHGRRLFELLKNGETRQFLFVIQRVGPTGQPFPADHAECFALV